jgi:hypothetical protein
MHLICFICSKKIPGYIKGLKSHFVYDHKIPFSKSNSYFSFFCMESNCGKCFQTFITFSRHIRNHYNNENLPSLPEIDRNVNLEEIEIFNEQPDNFLEIDNAEEIVPFLSTSQLNAPNVCSLSDLKDSANQILCKIRTNTSMTISNVNFVLENVDEVLEIVSNYTKLKLNNFFAAQEKTVEYYILMNSLNFDEVLNECNTYAKQTKWIKSRVPVIEPIEYKLGHRVETRQQNRFRSSLHSNIRNRFNNGQRFCFSKIVNETYQYIPLTETLKTIVGNPQLKRMIDEERVQPSPNVIESFIDGNQFKHHAFFQKFPHSIRVNLYYDDIEVCNPLGANRGVYKLAMFYFTVQNFPLKFSSHLDNIYLLAICHTTDLKKYGFSKILEPFVSELKHLSSETGVSIRLPNTEIFTMRAVLVSFSGDSEAAHATLGLLSCSANHFCRTCMIHRKDLLKYADKSFLMRNKELHDKQVKTVQNNPNQSTNTGVKCDSILNKVPYFHVADNLTFDPMHDLLEGVVPMEIKLVLQYFIYKKKYFSVQFLNEKIQLFDYGPIEAKNKPTANFMDVTLKSKDHKIRQKAVSCWLLLRSIPFFLHGRIPECDNEHVNLLIYLLKILEIVFCPTNSLSMIHQLKEYIHEHHTLFHKLFPDVPMINRHHHITHYPYCILMKGPMILYCVSRMESKHLSYKKQIQHAQNYINVPKSLVLRHSVNQSCAIFFQYNSSLIDKIKSAKFVLKDSCISSKFLQSQNPNDMCLNIMQTRIKDIEYKPGYICILKNTEFDYDDNSHPIFFMIAEIIKFENTIHFFGYHIKILAFESQLNSFRIKIDESESNELFVSSDQVFQCKPFSMWRSSFDNNSYIPLNIHF